jgi:rhamnogalacturonyl hydrolase YesR
MFGKMALTYDYYRQRRKNMSENQAYYREIAKKIIDRMIETRPKKDVVYRPFRDNDCQTFLAQHGIDLNKIFGRTYFNDYAFVTTNVKCPMDARVCMFFRGATAYRVNGGEWVSENFNMHEKYRQDIDLKEGYNEVVFKVVAGDTAMMPFFYLFSPVQFPGRTSNDYTLCLHDTIPLPEYEGEYGFAVSELCHAEIEFEKAPEQRKKYEDCKTVFPLPTESDRVIDFNKIYSLSDGDYALAYTTAKSDTKLKIKSACPITVYINGKKSKLGASLKAGDKIMLYVKKKRGIWGFESFINDAVYPVEITSKRENGTHWLLAGAFTDDECLKIDFKKPFSSKNGQKCYFRFADGSYLRPCLETFFYGQWFYALMVGQYGIRRASQLFPEYYDYFKGHIKILVDYFEYMLYEKTIFRELSFMRQSVDMNHFDGTGTMVMNMCDLYCDESDEEFKKTLMWVIRTITETVIPRIHRLDDGTFYRMPSNTLWADDGFMCNPFLVRVGNVTGETKYYDEVVAQLNHYYDKLFMKDKGIYAHIYYPDLMRHNSVPWGRGNGWVYLAYAEAIEKLPNDYPGRDGLIEKYREMIRGLVPYQAESGLWHQVINIPESYEETSCTAIFSISMAKMIKAGVISKDEYLPIIKKAVDGLLSKSLDENYNVLGVCKGSSCKDGPEYYINLGTVDNDDHGTGMVIYALCELSDLID